MTVGVVSFAFCQQRLAWLAIRLHASRQAQDVEPWRVPAGQARAGPLEGCCRTVNDGGGPGPSDDQRQQRAVVAERNEAGRRQEARGA